MLLLTHLLPLELAWLVPTKVTSPAVGLVPAAAASLMWHLVHRLWRPGLNMRVCLARTGRDLACIKMSTVSGTGEC